MNDEQKIKAGDHLGHVMSWGLSETKAGAPQVFAMFDIGLTWYGTLKEGRGREITLEALVTMGFKGDDLTDLVRNPIDCLDKNKDIRLAVEYEANQNGEMKPKIKWINDLSGPKNKLDEAGALKALSNLKVAGDLMKIRQEKGIKAETQLTETAGDIPF